jgi:hypothetical protein
MMHSESLNVMAISLIFFFFVSSEASRKAKERERGGEWYAIRKERERESA